jgi:hypothetical protein
MKSNYRTLSQEEIQYWSEKLQVNIWSDSLGGGLGSNCIDGNGHFTSKSIDYRLVFSVSINNVTRFENLVNTFVKEGFKQSISQSGKIYIQNSEELEKFKSFESKESHTTSGIQFVKYTYNFIKTPLLQTVFYCQLLKDAVNIIGTFWGYDETGKEICAIKYPVGSIVSLKNSEFDYFVESVEFLRKNTQKYLDFKHNLKFSEELILYNLLKMESDYNSQVLEFSEKIQTSSDYIKPNRNHRLNQLLQ